MPQKKITINTNRAIGRMDKRMLNSKLREMKRMGIKNVNLDVKQRAGGGAQISVEGGAASVRKMDKWLRGESVLAGKEGMKMSRSRYVAPTPAPSGPAVEAGKVGSLPAITPDVNRGPSAHVSNQPIANHGISQIPKGLPLRRIDIGVSNRGPQAITSPEGSFNQPINDMANATPAPSINDLPSNPSLTQEPSLQAPTASSDASTNLLSRRLQSEFSQGVDEIVEKGNQTTENSTLENSSLSSE